MTLTIFLNASFGIYAFLPQGWIFMTSIILLECLSLSFLLSKKWIGNGIWRTVFFTNIISGLIGIFGSIELNGGWWLVVWFPWVSNYEVNGYDALNQLKLFYAIAFGITVIIESIINIIILKKKFKIKDILLKTLLVNIISYIVGSFVFYSYTF